MDVYGSIKYGDDIYGNMPPAVQITVEGVEISGKVLRGFTIRDTLDSIKTCSFEVK
jgi:hypothetical protein